MRYAASTLAVCLTVFTGLSLAQPTWLTHLGITVGPLEVGVFDILLALSSGSFLYVVSLRTPTDASTANRAVLRLAGFYVLYQLLIVIPVAVLWYDVHMTEAYRLVLPRLALILIPFSYYVVLRHMRADRLVLIVNVAALTLLAYGLYRYAAVGPQGGLDNGEYRLRVLWGGSALLFGWLTITGLILQTRSFYAFVMSLSGLLGIVIVNHRSGYVAILFATVSYLLLTLRPSKRLITITVVAAIGGLLLCGASATIRENVTYSLTTMFNAHADVTAQDRVERSALAWDHVKANPLGDYVWNRTYYTVNLGTDAFGPHNWVVFALDTQGWLSACLLFAMVGSVLALGWITRRDSRLAISMTVYLVYYLSFCLFNGNFESLENISLFAFAVALLLHASRLHVATTPSPSGSPPTVQTASAPPTEVDFATASVCGRTSSRAGDARS